MPHITTVCDAPAACQNPREHIRKSVRKTVLSQTHVWYVASVCDVPDACERHLLGEGLTKAGQALCDLTAQQGGSTPRIYIILDHPLKRPECVAEMQRSSKIK